MLQAVELSYLHRQGRRQPRARSAALRTDLHPPGVRGITLRLAPRTLAGLIGPNGSGKTTLLRLLAGVLQPTGGRVFFDGQDLAAFSRTALARRLAVVPQETHLAFDYTVLEVVLMGRHPHLGAFQFEGPSDIRIARDALAQTGTADLEERSFQTLSGGEKQRVIIASALAQAADVLLLDEPTASLDLAYQIEIAELLIRLNVERKLTVLVATHDLNFAASVCGELFLLKAGTLLDAGNTESVLTTASIRSLYGVEADVRQSAAAGHVTVVPLRKARSSSQAGPAT